MTRSVEFPYMRLYVMSALESLSDLQHQLTRWGRYEEGVSYYDDLTLVVHVLYDDCVVLPDPQSRVSTVVVQEEVQVLRELDQVLGPMLDDLGAAKDEIYMADPRWPSVIEAAGRALAVMRQTDVEMPS